VALNGSTGTGTIIYSGTVFFEGHTANSDYICQVYDSTGGTDCNVATPGTAIPFDLQTIIDNMYTHSIITNPSRITVTRPGLYKVSYNISWEDSTSGRRDVRAYARINGNTAIVPSASYAYGRNTIEAEATNSATFFVTLSANDYIEIMCELAGSAGTSPAIANESWITMEFVR